MENAITIQSPAKRKAPLGQSMALSARHSEADIVAEMLIEREDIKDRIE